MTDEIAAELLAAAKEVMLGGKHKGRCTNEAPWDDGACERHWRKSERRHKRLAAAIAKAEEEFCACTPEQAAVRPCGKPVR